MKIALDGPSGAGKSTVARALAKKLGIIYVDTGALYRTIGLHAKLRGVGMYDTERIKELLPEITLGMEFINGEQIVTLNGVNVGDTIRTGEIAMYASSVSAIPEVRAFLLETQRKIARENSVVMDGRDIGTVVFPDAERKFFVTASPEERARRRMAQSNEIANGATFESILADIIARDERDMNREIAPLKQAADAILIDTTGLTIDEVVAKISSYC